LNKKNTLDIMLSLLLQPKATIICGSEITQHALRHGRGLHASSESLE